MAKSKKAGKVLKTISKDNNISSSISIFLY